MTENNPKPYSVRIPPKLRNNLELSAKNNGRSLHADILLRLEESFTYITTDGTLSLKDIDLSTPENMKILRKTIKEVVSEEREKEKANSKNKS